MLKRMTMMLIIGLVTGCASTPNVMYSYYPSRSASTVMVTETVDCNSAQTGLVLTYATTLNTLYSADYSKGPYSIEIRKLDGALADSDVDFSFFEDGRLKSINQSTTGQGETILKSAIGLATALTPLGAGPEVKGPIPECDIIKTWGGGKPVALIFTKSIEYGRDDDGQPKNLNPAPSSADLYTALNLGNLPVLQATITPPGNVTNRGSYVSPSSGSFDNVVLLTLQETENVKVDVTSSGRNIWSGTITIPGNKTYNLPIPKAALFGKQIFALSLSESGAITEIHYGKNTGAAGLLNVATSAATAAAPESTAAKAADIKAKADLIAQQQRLVRCQANPANCQ